jgi:hypothetical protein
MYDNNTSTHLGIEIGSESSGLGSGRSTRKRLQLPTILPRRLNNFKNTDPKVLVEFNNLFVKIDNTYHYGMKFVKGVQKIAHLLGNNEIFLLLKFLLLQIEQSRNTSSNHLNHLDHLKERNERSDLSDLKEQSDLNDLKERSDLSDIKERSDFERSDLERSDHYSWVTFFYCLEYLPARFYNENVDVTALILLKCYEFLTLNGNDDQSLRSLQETLEKITECIINKVSKNQRANLTSEILAGNLPCSIHNQYDAISLNHYLLGVRPMEYELTKN